MPRISRSAMLPYTQEQVYALVNDVASYPEYMEGCVGAEVLYRDADTMEARLDLAKAGLRYSFTTRNHLQPPHKVTMELVEGPFRAFAGEWVVQALGEAACKVTLQLDFTMKSRALSLAARSLFNPMADNLVDSLARRARQVYG